MRSLWRILVIVLLISNVYLLYSLNQNVGVDENAVLVRIEEKLHTMLLHLEFIKSNTF
jgi:hypothetical protein